MRVLGIDPSLTSLGYAYCTRNSAICGALKFNLRGQERIARLTTEVEILLDLSVPELVVIEGYAMGRFQGKMFERAELVGNLKSLFWNRTIETLVVPPTSLKLFATGSGRADKSQMKREMAKLYGRLFSTDDEADAYALMLFGLAYKSPRHRPRDSRHYKRAALRGASVLH